MMSVEWFVVRHMILWSKLWRERESRERKEIEKTRAVLLQLCVILIACALILCNVIEKMQPHWFTSSVDLNFQCSEIPTNFFAVCVTQNVYWKRKYIFFSLK